MCVNEFGPNSPDLVASATSNLYCGKSVFALSTIDGEISIPKTSNPWALNPAT